MENLTLQPQTLAALTELVRCWNQDPLATNYSLAITGTQAVVTDGTQIVVSVQIDTVETQSDPLDEYLPETDLDDLIYPEENEPEASTTSPPKEVLQEAITEADENNNLTQLAKDLKRTPIPTTKSTVNLFLGRT
jgi:hypothetical protein